MIFGGLLRTGRTPCCCGQSLPCVEAFTGGLRRKAWQHTGSTRRLPARLVSSMGHAFSSGRGEPKSTHGILRAQDRDAAVALAAANGTEAMWIIAGLGNPGSRYAGNRHNVGFKAVDTIAAQHGVRLDKLQHNAAVARCSIGGQRVLLAKPMTFMNNSGEAVGRLAKYYKVPSERVLVVYDDLDIATAVVRLRAKGGHGGHNGMRSLCQHLGGDNFPRIRIGVGRPPGQTTVIQHVLQDFSSQEQEGIALAIQEAIAVIKTILELGMERALSGMRVTA